MLESETKVVEEVENDAVEEADAELLADIDSMVEDVARAMEEKEKAKKEEEKGEVVEEVPEEEEVEDKGEVEEEVEEEKKEEVKKEEVKEEEVTDKKDEQISKLTSTVEKMQERIQSLVDELAERKKEKVEDKAEEEDSANDIVKEVAAKFFDEDDSIMDITPGKLNKALQEVHDATVASIMQQIPQTIQSQINQAIEIRDVVTDFFNENQDLSKHRKYLQHIAREVISEEPELTLEEMLNKAADRVREELGIPKEEEKEETKPKGRPAPVKGPGSRKAPSVRKPREKEEDPLLKEIDELIDLE